MAPVKTSPWAGLSEMTAVASTVDVRSKVSAPEVVICPDGVTVTAKAKGDSCRPGRHRCQTDPGPGRSKNIWGYSKAWDLGCMDTAMPWSQAGDQALVLYRQKTEA